MSQPSQPKWDQQQESRNRFKTFRIKMDAYNKSQRKLLEEFCKVHKSVLEGEDPDQFKLQRIRHTFSSTSYNYHVCISKVTQEMLNSSYWQTLIKEEAPFKEEAINIITLLCEAENSAIQSHPGHGFINSPRIQFCEELKSWAANVLSQLSTQQNDAPLKIEKRMKYLEQVLLHPKLIAQSTESFSLSQKILGVWRILKYRVLPKLERSSSTESIRSSITSLKNGVVSYLQIGIEFLSRVFRNNNYSVGEFPQDLIKQKETSRYSQVLKMLILSPEILSNVWPSLPHLSKMAEENSLQAPPPGGFIDIQNKHVAIAQCLLTTKQEDPFKLRPLQRKHLTEFFVGENSGAEILGFRACEENTSIFLNAVGLANKLGMLCSVLDQALSSVEGLVSHGPANAQVLNLLNSVDLMIVSFFQLLKNLKTITEGTFGYCNISTSPFQYHSSEWVNHAIPSIGQILREISTAILKVKIEVNTATLYDEYVPDSATLSFIKSAESYSKHVSVVLGVPYVEPIQPSLIKVPDLPTITSLVYPKEIASSLPHTSSSLSSSSSNKMVNQRLTLNITKMLIEEHNLRLSTQASSVQQQQMDLKASFSAPMKRGKNGQIKPIWSQGESSLVGTVTVSQWFYYSEQQQTWISYDNNMSQKVENCWLSGGLSFRIGDDMRISFGDRKQIKPYEVAVRRGTWYYREDNHNNENDNQQQQQQFKAIPYDESIAEGLEACVQNYNCWIAKINNNPPTIVVGQGEVFVEHSEDGTTKQVIRGVQQPSPPQQ